VVAIGGGFGWGAEPMQSMGEQGKARNHFYEIWEEFRTVFSGRVRWADSLLPPLFFLILNTVFGFQAALWGSLGMALLFVGFRLTRKQPLRYALGGLGGVILTVLVARFVGGAEGYYLPGIVSGVFTTLLCLVSVILRRPLVAWTSFFTRRWPLGWYWHPQVRPAYSEVTLAWAIFFALRTTLQFELFQDQAANALGLVQLISGWPAIIILLATSYLYGIWRLERLGGPSVVEFNADAEPPWEGQKRGF
jgi:hypothetical protein